MKNYIFLGEVGLVTGDISQDSQVIDRWSKSKTTLLHSIDR